MANTNYIDSFEVNGVEIPVRDPGISQWAREPSAPEYTAEDVGAFPAVPGGSAGQVLTKTADGQEWKTPSGAASYYKTFTAAFPDVFCLRDKECSCMVKCGTRSRVT